MNYILDAYTSHDTASRQFMLEDIQLPYGYFHEKIFQFCDCSYYSADWITIETLLTMKNCYSLDIGENWLSYTDMNRFLKFWTQSEVDMFDDYFNINMEEDIPENELFNGITRLNSSRFRSPTYFVVANSTQRKRQLLIIWYEEKKLKFAAWSPEDNCQDVNGRDVFFQKELDALKDVERQKELKKKLEENNNEEEIMKEIRELNEKLLELEVRGKFSIIESS
ncbi:hypothetical protein CRE_21008 [Caenorhabditis remanei]|uniref:Sdz-33 F-box domain-containing protein n=1 Tax=Caenorhabditis remanei TaxID=31234 RepID=E3NKX0_CAERE|nr:hypothetical protein CRE_21008 [Caenorhabditis remanei]